MQARYIRSHLAKITNAKHVPFDFDFAQYLSCW